MTEYNEKQIKRAEKRYSKMFNFLLLFGFFGTIVLGLIGISLCTLSEGRLLVFLLQRTFLTSNAGWSVVLYAVIMAILVFCKDRIAKDIQKLRN
jgi:hypothetical protein